jgi:hypothetical protein
MPRDARALSVATSVLPPQADKTEAATSKVVVGFTGWKIAGRRGDGEAGRRDVTFEER